MAGVYTPNLPNQVLVSGTELLAADFAPAAPAIGGLVPSAVALSASQIAGTLGQGSSQKNLLIGGDFTAGINLWQRGTSGTITSATPTYTADRWAAWTAGGGSGSVAWSQQADTNFATGDAWNHALRWGRTNGNANTGVIGLLQAIETKRSLPAIGEWVNFSFWAKAGATFATGATSGLVNVYISAGTGTDGSAANLVPATAGWTNFKQLTVNVPSYGLQTVSPANQASISGTYTGLQLTNTAYFVPSTAWQQYQFTAFVPATIAGSNVQQIGVVLTYTPTGTAGATEWVEFAQMQLEAVSSTAPFATLFEHRPADIEALLQYRFYYRLTETANTIFGSGIAIAANTPRVNIAFPTPMRIAPSNVTATVGGLSIATNTGAAVAQAALTGITAGVNTVFSGQIVGTNTIAQWSNITLYGTNTTGIFDFSAEL